MKKLAGLFVLLLILTGCHQASGPLHQAMTFREDLLEAKGCSFDAAVTADYGDSLHSFSMACQGDGQGNLTFTVTGPESISGITGRIRQSGGELIFDDTALQFTLLTDRQLSPGSAPWIFLKTLRSGYLTSAAQEEEGIRISADDSYEDDALHLDIRLSKENLPVSAEILWNNRRILTLEIENFQFLRDRIKAPSDWDNRVYALHRV